MPTVTRRLPELSFGKCVTGCNSQVVPEPNTLPISRRSSVSLRSDSGPVSTAEMTIRSMLFCSTR